MPSYDKLIDYMQVLPGFLTPEFCKVLIDEFEANKENWERIENDRRPNFTQLNLVQNNSPVVEPLIKVFKAFKNNVIDQSQLSEQIPKNYAWEEFRIKKYNKATNLRTADQFDWHVDVMNLETCKRFLAFQVYLNDDFSFGCTGFEFGNGRYEMVKPKTGSLLLFPPMWMFKHRGEPCIDNDKYILTTYLHYV